jgi:glycosyltransferase involved in cell wall biosynthesis
MNAAQVSIVLATRNREAVLWPTVAKAAAAINGKEAELIIVNDGDEGLNPPAALAGKVRHFRNPKRGVSSARNYGAANATGKILFFIDDDMWIVPEVIDWIIDKMNDEKNSGDVYNINWEYPSALFQKLEHSKVGRYLLDTNYHCMWGRMHEKGAQPPTGLYRCNSIASCSLVMHKEIFQKLNGYNEQMIFQGEDIDLSNRLRDMAVPVYAVFDVTLFHNHHDRLELAGYLQRLSSGYQSEMQAIQKGIIEPGTGYTGLKKTAFEFFRISEPFWIMLHQLLPSGKIVRPLNNKLIGTLAALQRYKQWRMNSK